MVAGGGAIMEHPQLPAGAENPDDLVENALLRRATGYEDAAGKPVPPDVRAAMNWLENRRPDRWKRRRRNRRSSFPTRRRRSDSGRTATREEYL